MIIAPIPQPAHSALVVEPDGIVRQRLCSMLRLQGLDVSDCSDFVEGRTLFSGQRLVVAPLNGDNQSMREFVSWVRTHTDGVQPWIIAMGGPRHRPAAGESPGDFGVNALLTEAMDSAELVRRLEGVGMGRWNDGPASVPAATPPQTQGPPSYQRPSSFQVRTWQGASAAVLLENFPASVAVLDRDLRYLACNQQWLANFQIPGDGFKGQSHYDFFPGLHPEWRTVYEKGLAGESSEFGGDLILLPDGSESPVRWEILPWRESHGLVGGILLSCELTGAAGENSLEAVAIPSAGEDAFPPAENPFPSSRKKPLDSMVADPATNKQTADLRKESDGILTTTEMSETWKIDGESSRICTDGLKSEPLSQGRAQLPVLRPDPVDSQFRELAEAAPFGMILLDDEARVLYANPQHQAVLGSSVEAAVSLSDWLRQAFPGEEDHCRKSLSDWWETVWTRHNSLTCALRNAEGLVKDIEFRPAPLTGNRLLLTIFDVTDARLEEQAVRSSEVRHRGLFNESPAPFVILNAAGHLVDVNPAFESFTGCTRQEIRRASLADFLPAEALRKMHPSTKGSNEPFSSWLTHRNGTTTAVRIAVSFIRGGPAQAGITGCAFMPLEEEEVLVNEESGPGPAISPPASAADNSQPAALAPQEWGDVTPDQLFVLDSAGLVLAHNHGRDFVDIVPPATSLHGQLLETALPRLTAPLPLEIMMERLLDAPGNEIRCAFRLSLPGEPGEFAIEARLIRLPSQTSSPSPATFGLTFRDVSHSTRTE